MAEPIVLVPAVRRRIAIDPVFLLPVIGAECLLVAWFGLDQGLERWRVATDVATALLFAAGGVTALCRRGPRVPGRLMVTIAATWPLASLAAAESSAAWIVGRLFESAPLALVVWLILSYPEGRAWSRAARATIVAAWVAVVVGTLSGILLDPTRSVFSPFDERPFEIGSRAASALGLLVAVSMAVLIVARLVRLQPAPRRVALPLLTAGLLTVPTSMAWLAIQADAGASSSLADTFFLVDRAVSMLVPLGYFAGLAWGRLRRSGVSSLVVDLREGGPTTLGERLARTLGDPSLEIAYWIDEPRGWVDGGGHPVTLPEPGERAVTQVTASGVRVAALIHDPALLDDPDLVRSVAAAAGLVLENERLAAEVLAQLAEVRASRARIVEATDAERHRLERDLHDGAQQRLVGLSLKLRLAQARTGDPDAVAALALAQDDLELALAELREFARGIHPTVLAEDGLDAALESLARRASFPVEIRGSVGGRLPATAELAAYFFVAEALTNVAKHAHATYATVEVSRSGSVLRIAVADDGVGGADAAKGSGLRGLSDRLAAVDATLTVASPIGEGTTLVAEIPCGS